jgi:hypothetical protein
MDQRIASTLGYLGTVAAAVLAAALMSGRALAEGPIETPPPFTGTLSRAQVQAQVLQDRGQITSFASEWTQQQDPSRPFSSGITRAQATAGYIAARDEVHAMTAEDSGSSAIGPMARRQPATIVAVGVRR